jgi:hypothetical protein
MSRLIAKDDFNTQNWLVTEEELSSYYADLCIGFTDQEPIINFINLKFGFTLSLNNEVIETQSYPPENVRYLQTDQEFLVIHRLSFSPKETYSLFMWAENDGKRYEYTYDFTTPLPPQPYSSWTWNGEIWEAPVPYPNDGEYYEWNEDTQEWDLMVFEGT